LAENGDVGLEACRFIDGPAPLPGEQNQWPAGAIAEAISAIRR
jgi:hypothetical protein